MKKLLLVFLFIFCKQIKAQSVFAPIGTYWNYSSADGNFGTKTLQYYSDTTINTYTCKKIKEWWYFLSGGPTPPDSGNTIEYIYEHNDSVFQYFPNDSYKFQLLYAFNQNLHDTIIFSPANPNYKLVLDSIKQTTMCSTSRRVLYYTKIDMFCGSPFNDSVRVVEGLSYVNDFLFSQIPSCVVADGRMNFECLNALGCIYARNGSSCTPLIYSGINQYSNNHAIKIYPNPASNKITINANDVVDVKLLDVLGKQISSTKQNQIDVSNLPNGVYFIQVQTKQNTTTQKIIIQH